MTGEHRALVTEAHQVIDLIGEPSRPLCLLLRRTLLPLSERQILSPNDDAPAFLA